MSVEFDPDWELEWEVGPDLDIQFGPEELTPDLPESQPEA